MIRLVAWRIIPTSWTEIWLVPLRGVHLDNRPFCTISYSTQIPPCPTDRTNSPCKTENPGIRTLRSSFSTTQSTLRQYNSFTSMTYLLIHPPFSSDSNLVAHANSTIPAEPVETRQTHIQYIIIASVISFAIFMLALVGITYYRHHRHRFHSRGQYDPVHPVAFPDYWEDLPKTPSSAKGPSEKRGTRPAFRHHSSSLSDAEATEHLLRPVSSVASTSTRSTGQTVMTSPASARIWR